MPNIPAVCDKCGNSVLSEVIVKDCTMHIHGHTEGPCACGGTFRILDGTYSHLGGPLNYCRATEADLAKFRDICHHCGVEVYQPAA
jgi:hypothetical protein